MAKNMQSKCDKYWGSMANMNFLLFVAIVLNPRYKLRYVEFYFEKLYSSRIANDMTTNVEDAFSRLYDWYYIYDSNQSIETLTLGQTSKVMDIENDDEDVHTLTTSQFKMHLKEVGSTVSKSELDEGCEEGGDIFDVLGWWKNNTSKYPILFQVARNVLAILVSKIASESTFSALGRVLDHFHSSLSPLTVEALICTQNWLKTSINISDAMEDVEECIKLEIGNLPNIIHSSFMVILNFLQYLVYFKVLL